MKTYTGGYGVLPHGLYGLDQWIIAATNDEEYLKAWQEYQYYYNKYLPTLALYSDLYHEFFNAKIQGYKGNVTANWTWSQQILYCTVVK